MSTTQPNSRTRPAVALDCPADGWCAAAAGAGGIVRIYRDGAWTSTQLSVPGASAPPVLWGIDCTAVDSCTTVGGYQNAAGAQRLVVHTLSRGGWSSHDPGLPADAGNSFSMVDLDCAAPDACVAVGSYQTAGEAGQRKGLIATLEAGSWRVSEAPGPSDAGTNEVTNLRSVDCPALGSCVASGQYIDSLGQRAITVLVQGPSGWSESRTELPATAATVGTSPTVAVECPAAGWCTVLITYLQDFVERAAYLTLADGIWTSAPGPVPADAVTVSPYFPTSRGIACWAPGACIAVGHYTTQPGSA